MSKPKRIMMHFFDRFWLIQLGRFVYRYRKLVIVIWAILAMLSLAAMPRLEGNLKGTGAVYEAGAAHLAEQRLVQELNISADALTIVFQAKTSTALAALPDVQTAIDRVRRLPNVRSVISAEQQPEYRSSDGQVQYAIVNLQPQTEQSFSNLDRIQQVLNDYQTENLQLFLTGKAAVDRSVQEISKAGLGQVEQVALPLTLIALLVVFGSLIAASLPVVMGVMTVSVTFGLLYLVSLKFGISVFALNITSMLGLGLGIDYSLLMVTRFREELVSNSVEEAVIRTVETAGRAVFFSGLTVGIGLISLLMFPIALVRSLGVAGALVVLTSVCAAATLIPAFLSVFGHRINWKRRSAEATQASWATIAQTVMRYRLIAIAVVLAIVLGLTSPFLSIRFGVPDANILPITTPAREGVNVLEQAFGLGEVSPILLAVHSQLDRPILSEDYVAILYAFVQQLQRDPRIARVNSLFNFDPQLDLQQYQKLYRSNAIAAPISSAVHQLSSKSTTLITIISRTGSNDAASQALVKDLRALSLDSFADLELQVAGQTASGLDTIDIVYQRFPHVLGAIVGVTFLVLCVLLQSIVLPIKAILMNFLSIGASFGTLVFVFQEGNFQSWLDFAAVGYLDILLPVVLFCILFGLSMDYEVFLLTRIKEIHDRTGNNSASVIEGLKQTGGLIASAALLMMIVSSAFVFTDIIFIKALGLGTAIAVLVDATIVRAVLVPATMHLMGEWNWWLPKWLRPLG